MFELICPYCKKPNSVDYFEKYNPYKENDDNDQIELIDTITILTTKFKLRTLRACMVNDDQIMFNTVINKFKKRLPEKEVEVLKKYSEFIYNNLHN